MITEICLAGMIMVGDTAVNPCNVNYLEPEDGKYCLVYFNGDSKNYVYAATDCEDLQKKINFAIYDHFTKLKELR